jgi:hypothetical protein
VPLMRELQPKTAVPEYVPSKTGQNGRSWKANEETAEICAGGINWDKSPRIVDENPQQESESVQAEKKRKYKAQD